MSVVVNVFSNLSAAIVLVSVIGIVAILFAIVLAVKTRADSSQVIYAIVVSIIIGIGCIFAVIALATVQQNFTPINTNNELLSITPKELNWGSSNAGSYVYRDVNVTNLGTVPLTLSMVYSDNPDYLTLSWNGDGVLAGGETKTVQFCLHSTPDALEGNFYMEATINGVG
jgi:hypothetical protein